MWKWCKKLVTVNTPGRKFKKNGTTKKERPMSSCSDLLIGMGWLLCRSSVIIVPPAIYAMSCCSRGWGPAVHHCVAVTQLMLGTWGCRPLLIPAPSLSHLWSTPQAVAHEAGTGGMVVGLSLAGSIRNPPYKQLLVGLGVAGSMAWLGCLTWMMGQWRVTERAVYWCLPDECPFERSPGGTGAPPGPPCSSQHNRDPSHPVWIWKRGGWLGCATMPRWRFKPRLSTLSLPYPK